MTYIILDGNAILNSSLLGGKDEEFGRTLIKEDGKKLQVNSAQYGVDKFFDQIDALCTEFDCAPRQMILVWDGKNAKNKRQQMHAGYKGGRDKAPEVSEQLNIARDLCNQMMLDLGAHVVSQVGYEADDVIGYLCKTLPGKKVVSTVDGDLSVLCDENTHVWRLGRMDENPYGPFPHKYITLYKALVGDGKDKIPGASGFGDGAWCDLVRTFGVENLEEFQNMILEGRLHELRENVADLKSLQKVIDSKDQVALSWNLAKLYTDEINTMRRPLQIQAGMVKQWGESDTQVREMRRFYGTKLLVTQSNYDAVLERLSLHKFGGSPFIALDIETSTSDESDEWMEALKKATESDRDRIDVLGQELTGMSLTFGGNTQHTIYMPVDHKDCENLTVDQVRAICELIPKDKHIIVQNRSFEFSVLYRTWGDKWMDNGWHGFLPNCLDTKVGASYVDENLKKGLKERSLHHLGYKQTSYDETTTKSGPAGTLTGGRVKRVYEKVLQEATYEQVPCEVTDEDTGEITIAFRNGAIIAQAVTQTWEDRQYKMNELTAKEVFDYGCDDTICTAALHTHYRFIMELENTWQVYLDVETLPEYLTSLAFVQGIPVSIPTLMAQEQQDKANYEHAWKVLREYLMQKGWEGTYCPELAQPIEPADVKEVVQILTGEEFTSRKRKLEALALEMRAQFPDNVKIATVATALEHKDVDTINRVLKANFTGEPKINFGSPKQMQNLFYNVIGIKPRIVNKMTDIQRQDPVMSAAFKKRRQEKEGHEVEYADEERAALISKSSTDDTAVDTALALDILTDDAKAVLKAYKTIKEVQTRQNLFYKTYKAIPHWRDDRIHPSLNQSEAVTRRYSSSGPNVQQLPSKGEGARFRKVLKAHHPDAVVVSLDFSGQELRLGAELSGDPGMTSCYVGENLRDMHSLTAVAAAVQMWGQPVSYEEFQAMRKSDNKEEATKSKKLRDDAKTVNFASQYGAMAAKIAETMMCDEETAQAFLDARAEAFPGIIAWDKRVQEEAKECGFSRTMLGARRHLREALLNDNHWERSKAERQVGNFWIQGSAAEMTKLAMARVWASGICTGKYDAVFYCPIHDELVFSVHKDQVYDFLVEAHACMVANYAGMKIPLESSIAIGPDFSCDFEIGNKPNLEEVQKVLNEIFHKNTTKEAA